MNMHVTICNIHFKIKRIRSAAGRCLFDSSWWTVSLQLSERRVSLSVMREMSSEHATSVVGWVI